MNNLDYFKNIEKDLKTFVDSSVDKVNAKDQLIKQWLKGLSETDFAKILAGYSRPNKWGLRNIVEFFDCHARQGQTSEDILASKLIKDPKSIFEKLDGTYGSHSFFNFVSLEELEQRFNDTYEIKSFSDYLSFCKKECDSFKAQEPNHEFAVDSSVVESYYVALYELLKTSHLLVFGLNSVAPRNFSSKMPYCYEVNVLVIPKEIIVPQELLRDAIDYKFIAEANIAKLVQVFYADQDEEDDF